MDSGTGDESGRMLQAGDAAAAGADCECWCAAAVNCPTPLDHHLHTLAAQGVNQCACVSLCLQTQLQQQLADVQVQSGSTIQQLEDQVGLLPRRGTSPGCWCCPMYITATAEELPKAWTRRLRGVDTATAPLEASLKQQPAMICPMFPHVSMCAGLLHVMCMSWTNRCSRCKPQ